MCINSYIQAILEVETLTMYMTKKIELALIHLTCSIRFYRLMT